MGLTKTFKDKMKEAALMFAGAVEKDVKKMNKQLKRLEKIRNG